MATQFDDIAEREDADRQRREQESLAAALSSIVSELEREAEDRVAKRAPVEKRWLRDLRQYNSEYEPDDLKRMKDAKKSTIFINQTRPKTNACEARLSDMLFPTDDDNWQIKPTPVPELTEGAKEAIAKAKEAVTQANEAVQAGDHEAGRQIALHGQEFAEQGKAMKAQMDEAHKRSDAMSAEIRDQLVECSYPIIARDVIRDACQMGTGVMLGPVGATERSRRSWKKITPDQGPDIYQLEMAPDARPAFRYVDPWGWFPQPDALTVDDSDSFFERYLNTPKAMRKLARQPGFNKDAIRRILQTGTSKALPSYMSELRAIKGDNMAQEENRYVVWCYRGPLTAEQMRVLCTCMDDDDMAAAAGLNDEIDPLEEITVVLWFCQGELLKFGIHHLDSGEGLYSVFNIEKDNASIWGYGIPYIMRNSQKAMNGAWRMMMDNSGLSSGPQIEIDLSVLDPADGDTTLVPRKIWLRKSDAPVNKPGIRTYNIDSHQAELAAIIELAKTFIDDETAISVLAQGEQGAHPVNTASGMAMLMNSVNVVFRRMVKGFDDDVTVPNIRRLYDWNMQFSKKEHIKGDYDVNARGTAVLLVREVQSQNLVLALHYIADPVLGQLLKAAPLLRKAFQSMMIQADEVVLTDDEIAEKIERDKENQKQDPEQMKLETQLQIATLEHDGRLQIADIERQTRMIELAEKNNMTLEELRAKLQMKQVETDSKERIIATEAALEARKDARGDASGSGGYV